MDIQAPCTPKRLAMKYFIHIPKCAGRSIRKVLRPPNIYLRHRKYKHMPDTVKANDCWAVIRNPYDRAVSMYGYILLRHGNFKIEPQKLLDWWKGSFTDYVVHGNPLSTLTDSQLSYIQRDDNILINLIRFENLEKELKDKVGIEIPHKNKSNRENDYRPYYTEELYDIITERYREDIETFGYTYD